MTNSDYENLFIRGDHFNCFKFPIIWNFPIIILFCHIFLEIFSIWAAWHTSCYRSQNTITTWHSSAWHHQTGFILLSVAGWGFGFSGEVHLVINWWLLGDQPGKEPFICSPALHQSVFVNSFRAPHSLPLLSETPPVHIAGCHRDSRDIWLKYDIRNVFGEGTVFLYLQWICWKGARE